MANTTYSFTKPKTDMYFIEKLKSFLFFIGGIVMLVLIWQVISMLTAANSLPIPTPVRTLEVLKEVLQNPWQDTPDTKGILIKLFSSLGRVFKGFLIGSLIAIPLGMLMGSSKFWMNLLNPIVQILRPVSPLAWFPLGLLALEDASGASVFMVVITSLWPTLINTAFGVSTIPQDHKNVAKAFDFSAFKYITKVLLPYSFPHIVTGLRLSIGVAWMVIVAGEMLSGGIGLGFFVWDDGFNAGSTEKIIIAIFIIGLVGLLLDKIFNSLQKRFSYDK